MRRQSPFAAAGDQRARQLYARRADLASARQAEAIWAARLAENGGHYESAWKLARVRYWLGGHVPTAQRKKLLEAGIAAGLLGGSSKKSEAHLRQSLTYGPDSTLSRFFLAKTLLGMDREAEALRELQHVIDAPIDPEWAPESQEYKERAQRLLTALRQKRL